MYNLNNMNFTRRSEFTDVNIEIAEMENQKHTRRFSIEMLQKWQRISVLVSTTFKYIVKFCPILKHVFGSIGGTYPPLHPTLDSKAWYQIFEVYHNLKYIAVNNSLYFRVLVIINCAICIGVYHLCCHKR